MEVFISYAHVDIKHVEPIIEIIRQLGHSPWFDTNLIGGEKWQEQLAQAIQKADALVYMMTPEAIRSEWCIWEVKQALELNRPVIPLRLHPKVEIPELLGDIQWIDFSGAEEKLAVAKLLRALTNIASKIPEQPRPVAVKPKFPPSQAKAPAKPIKIEEKDEQFRQLVNSALSSVGKKIYVHTPNTATEFFGRWQEIFAADICVFNLGESKSAYIELGIALALDKLAIITAHQDISLPDLLLGSYLISYSDLNHLNSELSAMAETLKNNRKLSISSYCHFCDKMTCRANSTKRDSQSYLVATDTRMAWRVLLRAVEQTIVATEATFPSYSSDVPQRVCEMRSKVASSQFLVSHLSYNNSPANLLMLGMAFAYARPWFLFYQDTEESPELLQLLDNHVDYGIEYFEIHHVAKLKEFLSTIYHSSSNQNLSMVTASATAWEQLDNLRGNRGGRAEEGSDPILGEIEIIRYNGKEIESTLYLHPRKQLLVFGRKEEKGVVPLRSPLASQTHFQIFKRDDRYYVEDLGSRNGTFLNRARLEANKPVEIFFKNKISAGNSHFLVWDERPRSQMNQVFGATEDLGASFTTIELDIEQPDDLRDLQNEIMVRVIYYPSALSQNMQPQQHLFEFQSYYPMREVLAFLSDVLNLPKLPHEMQFNGKMIDLSKTALTLGIQTGAVLNIVLNRVDACIYSAKTRIDHCRRDLSEEYNLKSGKNEILYKEDFRYIEYHNLLKEEYKTLFGKDEEFPEGTKIEATTCKKCGNEIGRSTLIAVAKKQQSAV